MITYTYRNSVTVRSGEGERFVLYTNEDNFDLRYFDNNNTPKGHVRIPFDVALVLGKELNAHGPVAEQIQKWPIKV